jgi:hypothetical protein
VPVISAKKYIFRNEGTAFRRCAQAVYFLFQFQYEYFCVIYVVGGDIEKDMLKILLGATGEMDFKFLWHV